MQLEMLRHLVIRHIQDPALAEIVGADDFAPTSTDRGVLRWEHAHIVSALDILNAYQHDRKAQMGTFMGMRAGIRKQYHKDPRTRLVELLKRWLRTQAGSQAISEEELRGVSGLCRDVMNHPKLFPARNERSFMRSIAEVYDHMQWQLREVLERDRTCADMVQRTLSLSRNLLSDAVAYLLLAATDMRQTDSLPSLEVVALWQSLPTDAHPLPNRVDPKLQYKMREAWRTRCGAMVAALVGTPWCVRLFDGAGAQEEAAAVVSASPDLDCNRASRLRRELMSPLIEEARAEFEKGNFKNSGLAGAFRKASGRAAWEAYLTAVLTAFDLAYLLGEAMVQFHRISDGLGDYGMIRVAPWLHPFLEALTEKVQRLKGCLETLNEAVDSALVLTRARGQTVEKPSPSDQMSARAHGAISRAVINRDSHAQALLGALEELRVRSAPERLPHLVEGLGDACIQLQAVLSSPEFRLCVGDSFPELPALGSPMGGAVAAAVPAIAAAPAVPAIEAAPGERGLVSCSDTGTGSASGSLGSPISNSGVQIEELEDQPPEGTNAPEVSSLSSAGSPVAEDLPKPPSTSIGSVGDSVPRVPVAMAGIGCGSLRSRSSSAVGRLRGASPARVAGAVGAAIRDRASRRRETDSPGPVLEPSFPSPAEAIAPSPTFSRSNTNSPASQPTPPRPPTLTLPAAALRRSSTTPVKEQQPKADKKQPSIQALVERLAPARYGEGWRCHDRRLLMISRGKLRIFNKSSSSDVKDVFDVQADVDECMQVSDTILSVHVRRVPKGAQANDGVMEYKVYHFRFPTREVTKQFYEAFVGTSQVAAEDTLARRGGA